MQRLRFIFSVSLFVIIAVLIALFCLENNQSVTVDLLYAEWEVGLGLGFLCLIIFILGGFAGLLASFPIYAKQTLSLRKLRKSVDQLERKQNSSSQLSAATHKEKTSSAG